jgi:hypothetical protein
VADVADLADLAGDRGFISRRCVFLVKFRYA